MRLRVLFWTGTFWPHIGGVQVLATKLLSALRRRGYEFLVVTPLRSDDQETTARYRGIPIYRLPFWNGHNDIKQLMKLRQEVAKLKCTFEPDLVHINAVGVSDFFHLTTAKKYSAPLLVTLHGEWKTALDSLVEKTLRAADWVIGCSKAILVKAQQLVPQIISCSSVVYNGLDSPPYLPSPLPFDPPVLMCLGRLVAEKGFDLVIDAFASVVDRFPEVRLAIAGDGPARSDLEKQASELDVDGLVTFLGQVMPDNVMSILNKATMVIIPSRQEAFSLVALEAALMARPVVATRVGGLPEVVAQKQTGLLVEQDDSRAIAEAIEFLLEHPKTATEMGNASRRRAQEVFGWKRYENAYDLIYRRLISGTISDNNIKPSMFQNTV
jgi:glycosyltransferase involved in cell wall biosynthesis